MEDVSASMLFMDNGTYGCGPAHAKVWQYLAGKTDEWSVVLEDDAEPVDDFHHQLEQALTAAPSDVVGLYLGDPSHWGTYAQRQQRLRTAGAEADEADACWITTTEILHGVGIAIKTPLVPAMLEYLATSKRPYDYAIRNWARKAGHTISLAWPSILDHADGETLVNHPDGLQRGVRRAWRVGTRTQWTSTAVTL